MDTLMQNPQAIPWIALAFLLLSGLFLVIRSQAKKLASPDVSSAEKRFPIGSVGLMLMIGGLASIGGNIGFLHQEGVQLYWIGGAGIGAGIGSVIVGVIVLAIACNWSFNSSRY